MRSIRTILVSGMAALAAVAQLGLSGAFAAQALAETDDGCNAPCVEVGLVDRRWHVTEQFTREYIDTYFKETGWKYRLRILPTQRAFLMMGRGEFDIFLFFEGKLPAGTILTQNRIFDVYAAAIGRIDDRRLDRLPKSAEGMTAASIRGDDLFRFLPEGQKNIRVEHLKQAFSMLDRGRVDFLTEYAIQTDMGLLVPQFEPTLYRIVKLSGLLQMKPMFLDTQRGKEIRDQMDSWIWASAQANTLKPIYSRHGLARSYPAEFADPSAKYP